MARGLRKNRSLERHNDSRSSYQDRKAYDYATSPVQKSKTSKPKTRGIKKKKQKIKYVYSDVPGVKVSISIYLTIVLIFLCALATSISFANVSLQRNYNQHLFSQLREMERLTVDLGMQVLEARNLEEIEYLARTRLQMSEPNPHQIIHISVDMQSAVYDTSYVVEHLAEQLNAEQPLLERVIYILINMKNFLLGR